MFWAASMAQFVIYAKITFKFPKKLSLSALYGMELGQAGLLLKNFVFSTKRSSLNLLSLPWFSLGKWALGEWAPAFLLLVSKWTVIEKERKHKCNYIVGENGEGSREGRSEAHQHVQMTVR